MQLNLPILDQLSPCRNLLIAGMGGGFDVFCGLPIYFELQRREEVIIWAFHKTGACPRESRPSPGDLLIRPF
jgi:hypothetical protein